MNHPLMLIVGDEFDTHPSPYPTAPRRGYVTRVIDGDTYIVKVDKGEHDTSMMEIRLRGVDTPEMRTAAGPPATAAVAAFILGQPILVTTYKDRRSFIRYIADISVFHQGVWFDLKSWIIEHGWGVAYRG